MEEWVGHWWHRAISRAASREHEAARVTLAAVQPLLGTLFRAAGGDAAARLAPAGAVAVAGDRAARGWLQRVAGSGTRAAVAQWQPDVLALPPAIAVFADPTLNRELYLWLAALAGSYRPRQGWIGDNLAATARALARFPGLVPRFERLREAHLAQRPATGHSPAEAAVQAALRAPVGTAAALSGVTVADVAPVWLWLDGPASCGEAAGRGVAERHGDEPMPPAGATPSDAASDSTRRRAERTRDERGRAPLLMMFRAESLMSFGEFMKIDRAGDDTPDDHALTVAADLDRIAVAPDGSGLAARVKFDLDLPSAAADDLPLGAGVPLPEWDWRRRELRPAYCTAQLRVARPGEPFVPPPALRATARRLRRRLEVLQAAPRWQRGQPQGERIDLDAWVRHSVAAAGQGATVPAAPLVYAERRRSERELATLLLADLSLSTDAWVRGDAATGRPDRRVIDVVRDALYVFGEALAATGDAFEMLGFSSVRRHQVRMQHLKGFDEAWGARAAERLGALKPGWYTRMGAAVRFATQRLAARPERQRVLLLLTDGKPNDLDAYEGRYGLEDTRHAVQQARDAGLTPFCVTIDQQAHDYLPALFGQRGFALVRRPAELVSRLAQLHASLAR